MAAEILSTSTGDPATRFVVHTGVCSGAVKVGDSELLGEYSLVVRAIASDRVMELIEKCQSDELTTFCRALTTIDHRGQPYAFERTVNWFVADGLEFIDRNGEVVEIEATHPLRVYQEDVEKNEYKLALRDFYCPWEGAFPVVDGYSLYCIVQATVAKWHTLNWQDKFFVKVLDDIRRGRHDHQIGGNIPFLFIVPAGQTCKTVEHGMPPEDVDVYILSISDLPGKLSEVHEVETVQQPNQVIVPTGPPYDNRQNNPSGRRVIGFRWKEHGVRQSERIRARQGNHHGIQNDSP